MRLLLIGVSALVALVHWTTTARPCSFPTHETHLLDPVQVDRDSEAPEAPGRVRVAAIKRGVGPDFTGTTTSCDDLGTLVIAFDAAQDLDTPPQHMGYELTLASGTPPAGMTLPGEPIRSLPGASRLLFAWVDGASDQQEPIEFALDIRAVDLAGNTSDQVRVEIRHPGHDGCSAAPAAPRLGSWALLLLLLAGFATRRALAVPPARRRRTPRARRSRPSPAAARVSLRGY